jgi:hypothetical protein
MKTRVLASMRRLFAVNPVNACYGDISTVTICPCSSLFRRLAQQLRRFAEPYEGLTESMPSMSTFLKEGMLRFSRHA